MYFYRTYTATVSGSITRRARCIRCSSVFEYVITREASGGGHSAYFLNNAGAETSAETRARNNLNRALNEAVEPVHCSACGIYQPEMVQILRERLGKQYEPNKYAAERIAVPVEQAWLAACAANTVASYADFMEVWPTHSWYAEKQIKELRYPPRLQKLLSGLGWILWALLFLVFVGFAITNFR
jgi:hypothetical protein